MEEKKLLKSLKMKYLYFIMTKNMKKKWSLKKKKKKKKKFNANKFNKWVNKKEISVNKELFKNYFSFQTPSALLKEINRLLVSVINSGLKDLKRRN